MNKKSLLSRALRKLRFIWRAHAIGRAMDSTAAQVNAVGNGWCIFECQPELRDALKLVLSEEAYAKLRFEHFNGVAMVGYFPEQNGLTYADTFNLQRPLRG